MQDQQSVVDMQAQLLATVKRKLKGAEITIHVHCSNTLKVIL